MRDFRYLWHLITTRLGVDDPTEKGTELATKIRMRRERTGTFMNSLDVGQSVTVP